MEEADLGGGEPQLLGAGCWCSGDDQEGSIGMQSGPFKYIFDLCIYYLQLIDKTKHALCIKPKDDPAVFI